MIGRQFSLWQGISFPSKNKCNFNNVSCRFLTEKWSGSINGTPFAHCSLCPKVVRCQGNGFNLSIIEEATSDGKCKTVQFTLTPGLFGWKFSAKKIHSFNSAKILCKSQDSSSPWLELMEKNGPQEKKNTPLTPSFIERPTKQSLTTNYGLFVCGEWDT